MSKLKDEAEPLDAKKLTEQQQNTLYDQFVQLMKRTFKNLTRNTKFIVVRIGQMVIVGLIMMILFWDIRGYDYNTVRNKNGAYYFVCVAQLMLSVQSVILTCILNLIIIVPLERGLFLREQANRMYGTLPYYLTKTFVEMPYQLLMPILFTLIIYWAVGFRNEAGSFFIFLAGLMLMVFFGNSIGVLMSSMFSNVRAVFAAVPVCFITNIR